MSKSEEKKRSGLGDYFRHVKAETKKVVWPDRKELANYTGVVIVTCLFFAVSIWAVDSIFNGAIGAIFNINL